MPGFGYTSFIGAAVETTWGTKVSPATKFLEPVKGGDRLRSNEPLLVSSGINEISTHKSRKVRRGGIRAGGEIQYELPYQGAETFLKYAFGKATTTGTSPYTHTFDASPADFLALVSLTLEAKRDHASANSFYFEGCVGTFIEFALAAEGFWIVTQGFTAEDVTTGASSTATLPAAPLANFYDAGTGSQLTWGGTASEVTDFNVRLAWGLNDNRRGMGSRLIKKSVFGGSKMAVTGSFKSTFESMAHFDDFRAATERILAIKSVGDAITGGNYSFALNVPVAVITPTGEPDVADEGIIYATIPFQGFWDGTSREINAVLVNSLATI